MGEHDQKFTAEEKRDCARREVKLRRRVYPRRIDNGHMTQALADKQIALMEEIAADYEESAAGERLI